MMTMIQSIPPLLHTPLFGAGQPLQAWLEHGVTRRLYIHDSVTGVVYVAAERPRRGRHLIGQHSGYYCVDTEMRPGHFNGQAWQAAAGDLVPVQASVTRDLPLGMRSKVRLVGRAPRHM
ncbi:MAG: hypothetical protein AB7P76_10380 [Candidatus Melainabacteria bacterium]